MNYPTFDAKGDISMHEIMSAKSADFIPDLGIKFIVDELTEFKKFLESCDEYCGSNHFQSKGFDKMFSDYIHGKLDLYRTEGSYHRTPGCTLTPADCFWYNIYCNSIHVYPFHHCSEKDSQLFHIERLEKTLAELAKNA